MSASTVSDTYTLAHTAQCKLRLAASRPDRNLRFLLGHSFTFEKVMLKIVEIESDSSDSEPESPEATTKAEPEPTNPNPARRVSFKDNSNRPTGELRQEDPPIDPKKKMGRASSPPPNPSSNRYDDYEDDEKEEEDDEDDEEYALDDDEDDDGLGLTRFTSASAQPPRMIPDKSDEPEPLLKSPPSRPSDEVLATIMEEETNEVLAELYNRVQNCGCQNYVDHKAPAIEKIWEVPGEEGKGLGEGGRRTALISVSA